MCPKETNKNGNNNNITMMMRINPEFDSKKKTLNIYLSWNKKKNKE